MSSATVYVELPPEGAASWREPVSTATALPATASLGDARVAQDTSTIYVWTGSAWQAAGGGGGGGLTSINSDATAAQILAVGTAGTDFALVDNGSGTHTFNLPSASATARGVVTTGSQTIAGAKTFSGAITASNLSGTNTGDVTLAAVGSSPGANGASLSGQALTLQPADGTNPGLVTAGTQTIGGNKTFSGTIGASNLSGTNSGDVTLAAVGSSPSANGASLSGQALTLQPADATHPGLVTTAAQTIAGDKTLSGTTATAVINANGASTVGVINLKATGTGLTTALNIVSSGGSATLSLNIRDAGTCFLFDGSNVLFNNSGSLCGTGPSTPNYQWDVNRGNSSTSITAQNQVCTIGIRNTDGTNGNFSELAFVNNQPKIDSAVVGVHDTQGATYAGSLHFLTSTGGTLTDNMILSTVGQLALQKAGAGLSIKEGSNCKMGVSTLVGGTVTVSTTAVTASSRIFLTHQTAGGTIGVASVGTVTAGTSFVINSGSAIDTSIIAWMIVEPS